MVLHCCTLLNTFLSKCGYVIHQFNAHFSLCLFVCLFLLMTYCCLFYIYFSLGKWCWTKSKFEQFSYLSSKWVIKQQWQLTTSTMHLAQELLMNIQYSGGSSSFAEETRALKLRSTVAGYIGSWRPIESIVEADALKTPQEVAQELSINHFMVIWHLRQIGKVKKFDK